MQAECLARVLRQGGELRQRSTKFLRRLADGVGFEPTDACTSPVFKTGAFNPSATHPSGACRGRSLTFQVMSSHFALIAWVHPCRAGLCTGRDEPSWRAKGFAP